MTNITKYCKRFSTSLWTKPYRKQRLTIRNKNDFIRMIILEKGLASFYRIYEDWFIQFYVSFLWVTPRGLRGYLLFRKSPLVGPRGIIWDILGIWDRIQISCKESRTSILLIQSLFLPFFNYQIVFLGRMAQAPKLLMRFIIKF